jgi:hypothetical protein
MQTLEQRCLAGHVVANCRLHARHVVGMHERAPVGRLPGRHVVIAQHGLPARREIDPIVERIEVPEAVVRAVEREFVAFLESRAIAPESMMRSSPVARLLPTSLSSRCSCTSQLSRGSAPAIPRMPAGRSSMKYPIIRIEPMPRFAPDRGVFSLIGAHVRGIAHLRNPQRGKPRTKPGQHGQGLAAQLFGIAGCEHAARDRDFAECFRFGIQMDVKCGVGARGLAQQLQIRADTRRRSGSGHRLEIDRDLGADDVEADRRDSSRGASTSAGTAHPTP